MFRALNFDGWRWKRKVSGKSVSFTTTGESRSFRLHNSRPEFTTTALSSALWNAFPAVTCFPPSGKTRLFYGYQSSWGLSSVCLGLHVASQSYLWRACALIKQIMPFTCPPSLSVSGRGELCSCCWNTKSSGSVMQYGERTEWDFWELTSFQPNTAWAKCSLSWNSGGFTLQVNVKPGKSLQHHKHKAAIIVLEMRRAEIRRWMQRNCMCGSSWPAKWLLLPLADGYVCFFYPSAGRITSKLQKWLS